jgi:flagellar hook protein FlgE
MSNYDKILRDKEQTAPVEKDRLQKNWAAMEKLFDAENKKADSKNTHTGKFRKLFLAGSLLALCGLLLVLYINNAKEKIETNESLHLSKIIPPVADWNIPYETFFYTAESGDTFFTRNGSILLFPKNALLNKQGKLVTGLVEIRTREFNDPFDFAIAGIPMTYDSAGKQYTFISSAMIDISATQNKEPVFVNPGAKPILNLVSTNTNNETNVYKLDTVTGHWENKGKDEINDLRVPLKGFKTDVKPQNPAPAVTPINSRLKPEESIAETIIISKPIPPVNASGKNPVIEIFIDPASFKELLVYQHLKFEVLDASFEKVGNDSKTEWENVQLEKVKEKYFAKFSTGNRGIRYAVMPVLENNDFAVAEKWYREKITEYERMLTLKSKSSISGDSMGATTEVTNDLSIPRSKVKFRNVPGTKAPPDSMFGSPLNNMKREQLDQLLEARDNALELQNQLGSLAKRKTAEQIKRNRQYMDSLLKISKANNKQYAEYKQQQATAVLLRKQQDSIEDLYSRFDGFNVLENKLIRTFSIDGFGYWNCDVPYPPNVVSMNVNFLNDDAKYISLVKTYTMDPNINRLINCFNGQLCYVAESKNLVWGIAPDGIYFSVIGEGKKPPFSNSSNRFVLRMQKMTFQNGSVRSIKKKLMESFNELRVVAAG